MKYFGSWVGHSFSSKNLILKSTESIAIVNRKLDGSSVLQEFRYLKNKNGEHRIIMLDCNKEDNKDEYYTWLTNDAFFSDFIVRVRDCGEITQEEFEKIKNYLLSKGIEVVEKKPIEKEEPDDLEELNYL